jgi:hypothetical protein
MKILPELSKTQSGSEVSQWSDRCWDLESLNALANVVDTQIESGAVFASGSWAPLGDRISKNELLAVRQEMKVVVEENAPIHSVTKLERMSHVTNCDVDAAAIIWKHLSMIGGGLASSADCWKWFAVRVIPDLIIRRCVDGGGHISAERFLNTTKIRCWPQHLWWYAWSCASVSGELCPDLMNFMKSADARVAIFERPGGGYDRPVLQTIMKQIIRDREERHGSESVEFLLRGMMVRLSWLSGARNIDALGHAEKQQLAEELCVWSREHYTGKR